MDAILSLDKLLDITIYLRIFILITLVALSIVSRPRLFKKIPAFGTALTFVLSILLILNFGMYFLGITVSGSILSILFTVALALWMIVWAVEIAYYEKD